MSDIVGTIVLIVGIVVVAAWIGAFADAIGRTRHEWTAAGLQRSLWIGLLIVFGAVLSPVYYFVVRPKLDATIVRNPPEERAFVDASVLDDVEPVPGSAKPDPILVVDGVKRTFGGLQAVDVDHLEIQRGLITGLIGPNGAGKTTLFNLLTGFDTPDEGEWTFNGMDMSGSVAHLMAERGMALLDRFGIVHMADEYAGTMSGGQRKLLEMARALMTEPELVMLDEPMAGVNPALTQSLLEHVKELREEGMSVIFVEHDMDVVRDISDWVVVMAEGAIIAEGSHESVTSNRHVIDAYLGSQHDDPVDIRAGGDDG